MLHITHICLCIHTYASYVSYRKIRCKLQCQMQVSRTCINNNILQNTSRYNYLYMSYIPVSGTVVVLIYQTVSLSQLCKSPSSSLSGMFTLFVVHLLSTHKTCLAYSVQNAFIISGFSTTLNHRK